MSALAPRWRLSNRVLPSPAKAPPSDPDWIHEIKHDGFRILARRDGAGVRLITRNGNDFRSRFPLAVDAVTRLPAHSFLLDAGVWPRGLARPIRPLPAQQRCGETRIAANIAKLPDLGEHNAQGGHVCL